VRKILTYHLLTLAKLITYLYWR